MLNELQALLMADLVPNRAAPEPVLNQLIYEPRTIGAMAGVPNPKDPYEILVGADVLDEDEEDTTLEALLDEDE